MNQIFLQILENSIYASVLILALLILRKVLKNKISINLYVFMWAFVFLRMLIPMFSVPISVIDRGNYVIQNTQTENELTLDTDGQDSNTTGSNNGNINYQIPIQRPAHNSGLVMQLISYIWLSGVAALLLIHAIIYIKFINKLKSTELCLDVELNSALEDAKKDFSIKKNIQIRYINDSYTPCIIGIFKPILLLPTDIKSLNYRNIILHEVSHIKGHDILRAMIKKMISIIHWFNPLAWLAINVTNTYNEIQCDNRVLKKLDHKQVINYGETIISYATKSRKHLIPIQAGTFGTKNNVKLRIANITDIPKRSKIITIACSIIFTMLFASCSVQPSNNISSDIITGTQSASDILNKAEENLKTNNNYTMNIDVTSQAFNNLTSTLKGFKTEGIYNGRKSILVNIETASNTSNAENSNKVQFYDGLNYYKSENDGESWEKTDQHTFENEISLESIIGIPLDNSDAIKNENIENKDHEYYITIELNDITSNTITKTFKPIEIIIDEQDNFISIETEITSIVSGNNSLSVTSKGSYTFTKNNQQEIIAPNGWSAS